MSRRRSGFTVIEVSLAVAVMAFASLTMAYLIRSSILGEQASLFVYQLRTIENAAWEYRRQAIANESNTQGDAWPTAQQIVSAGLIDVVEFESPFGGSITVSTIERSYDVTHSGARADQHLEIAFQSQNIDQDTLSGITRLLGTARLREVATSGSTREIRYLVRGHDRSAGLDGTFRAEEWVSLSGSNLAGRLEMAGSGVEMINAASVTSTFGYGVDAGPDTPLRALVVNKLVIPDTAENAVLVSGLARRFVLGDHPDFNRRYNWAHGVGLLNMRPVASWRPHSQIEVAGETAFMNANVDVGVNTVYLAYSDLGMTSYSDRRLKRDIQSLNDQWARNVVESVPVLRYRLSGDSTWRLGVAAQDVRDVPGMVTQHQDYLHVDYIRSTPLLWGALRDMMSSLKTAEKSRQDNEALLSQVNADICAAVTALSARQKAALVARDLPDQYRSCAGDEAVSANSVEFSP